MLIAPFQTTRKTTTVLRYRVILLRDFAPGIAARSSFGAHRNILADMKSVEHRHADTIRT